MSKASEDAALIFAVETRQKAVILQGLGLTMEEARKRLKQIFLSTDAYLREVDAEVEHMYKMATGKSNKVPVHLAESGISETIQTHGKNAGERSTQLLQQEDVEIVEDVDSFFSDWSEEAAETDGDLAVEAPADEDSIVPEDDEPKA